MIDDSRVLNTRPIPAQNAMTRYRNIAIQADGTWMKMIRYESPCWASTGARKKPMYRPITASRPPARNQGASLPASG
jgi:hypothetical protein